ncbi:MAG: TRIC cation channel family protein [Actinobacteria bacterium]|nr:TRIC cation channel family protein [Actinomycetota bacterium]
MIGGSEASSSIFLVIEVIGTVTFAISGVMAAARASMDWLGAIVLAVVVAIGGGTIRDVLIGRFPVSWIEDASPVLVAIGTAVIVIAILRLRPQADLVTWTPTLIADAAGLSAFVILGTDIALESGLDGFLAILLGTITGVGGGVLRDILTGNKPIVLVGQVYALAGIAGATLFVVLIELGVNPDLSVWLPMAVIFGIRMLSIRRDWHLPKVVSQA